jgi:adenylate cyclase
MLLKFITKSLRPLGLFFILIFSIFLIIGSLLKETAGLGKFFAYTSSMENRFYDARMVDNLDHNFRSEEIVLLKIDDYSLQKIGVWPIPRTEHAKMVRRLQHFGAKVVAFDVMYPEKSPQFGEVNPDEELAQSFSEFQEAGGRIFLAYTTAPKDSGEPALEETPVEMLNDIIQVRTAPNANLRPMEISKFTFPIERFVETEAGLGTINMIEDRDGIFRRYHLVSNIDTIYLGSLALNAYEAFSGEKISVDIFSDGTGRIEMDGRHMELNSQGETKVRWIGGEENFPSVSLYDLLVAADDDEAMKKSLSGKMVFIGSTATGAHDLRPSPLDAKMPGVLAHMNMAHMLLHQFFYQDPEASVKISLAYLILGMFIFLLVQRLGQAFLDALVIGAIIVVGYYVDSHYFMPRGYELKLFYCFFCFTTSYSWNTFLLFYEANKEKKQIKGTFSRYVAPTVVEEMLRDPSKLQVGGQKMDITCLFSDVRDFTSISESLSANDLSQSMNMYMTAMTDIVFDTKGTLDKYIGDAIVAIWGAPLPIGNHAQHAVEAAIKMMNALPKVNEEFVRLGRPIFKVGIGLNSGECSVGNMGSTRIFSYTALGDNMNLGARVESLCKHYGAQILITDYTLERLDLTHIKTRPMDKVIVKGKSVPVGIHEVLYEHHWMTKDPDALGLFLQAVERFRQKNFAEAKSVFEQLLAANPEDKASKRHLKLCEHYLAHPEAVDDAFDVTKMTEK